MNISDDSYKANFARNIIVIIIIRKPILATYIFSKPAAVEPELNDSM